RGEDAMSSPTACRRFLRCVALCLAATGCAGGSAQKAPADGAASSKGPLAGHVTVDGSSTVLPVSRSMAAAFRKANTAVQVSVESSGTAGGFRKFCAGQLDITGASRPINANEVAQCTANHVEYIELPVAVDSLSVVVNAQNTFAGGLGVAELKKMGEPAAEGKVTRWTQIRSSFPDEPLALFGPGDDSGTFDYFTLAIVGQEHKSRRDYTRSEDDTTLVNAIAVHSN